MKQIKLMRLTMRDFKGFTYEVTPNGQDISIWGANATGKTTIADGFSWLLFDKDSLGRSDFEIKNLNSQGEQEHNLEHTVEGALTVNGEPITLKKIYKELWTRKRGEAHKTFTGHTTDYYIDGVPVQLKEYRQRVADITGLEDTFRLLTSPVAFPALHWQKQRDILLTVCGDISDADVIDTDPELAPLTGILGRRNIEEHMKVIAASRSELNKNLEKIPVRIDEQRRMIPDITGLDRKALEKELKEIETALNDKKLQLQGVDTGGKIAELTKLSSFINLELRRMEQEHYAAQMKKVEKLRESTFAVTNELTRSQRRIEAIEETVKRKDLYASDLNGRIEAKRTEWANRDKQTWAREKCPVCKQSLPDSMQESEADFNEKKSKDLEEITAKGREMRAELDALTEEVFALRAEQAELNLRLPVLTKDVENFTRMLENAQKAAQDYSSVEGYQALLDKLSMTEAEIEAEKAGRSQGSEATRAEIAPLQARFQEINELLSRFTYHKQGEDRIKHLMDEEKQLAAEYERLGRELFLCEKFIEKKVDLLTEKINAKFRIARFKLFIKQINEGIKPCCEITVNGIPFNGGLNNAARINAGLDVCRTLAEHYGLRAPVFVDNAESVTHLVNMETQVIRLVVSEPDLTLRVVGDTTI